MTKKPYFSIVIPVLNEEKYLPLLLSDLSKQSYTSFEVIVVDGKSDDNTIPNIQKFKTRLPQFTILESPKKNVSVQRNMGADKANSEYIIFNDADNRLPPYFLEGLHYRLQVKPIDVFTCWSLPDSEKAGDKAIASYLNLLVETANNLNQPSAFGALIGCRKNIFSHIKFNPQIGFSEDTEFVKDTKKKGYSFTIFRDPRYIYSLRRFRKLGTLGSIQKYATLQLKYFTKQKINQKTEYPMGGELFGNLPKKLPQISNKPKIIEKIKNILDQLEES